MRWMDGSWPASQDVSAWLAFVLYLVRAESERAFFTSSLACQEKIARVEAGAVRYQFGG